jgi:hypothetical protein
MSVGSSEKGGRNEASRLTCLLTNDPTAIPATGVKYEIYDASVNFFEDQGGLRPWFLPIIWFGECRLFSVAPQMYSYTRPTYLSPTP